ncbi:MAG: 4Fe-4S dicluster domain-containing protein [Candidatus Mcinerneyibacterium aminivorans]|uniref:4Fe-4S dicluster domain-containing protein n=1 Tax=Candidatus Mcinerneyibacterium aminivorans TaxID=2703815 RepID=A0A5D0MIN0_9BACT|nr:MAG: 4Fe-4S dicluster domain-containing protein [Candidatus Mcinerneyibacterium aminivorans]
MKKGNINIVKDKDLCVSCGMCYTICPHNAINMKFHKGKFIPVLNDNCVDCGKCLSYCPSYKIEINNISNFSKEDILFGRYKELYTAYLLNEDIRFDATSGGIITGIIIKLLETGAYDGSFVLPFETYKGEEVKLSLAETKNEVLKALKSKYCPVSIENVIKKISNNPESKYIIVGTPCQFYSIKKYINENKNLISDNYLFLGLFCDSTMNFNFLNYIKDKYNIKKEISKFEYRSKKKRGWPGDLRVVFNDGEELIINRNERIKIKNYFKLNRCKYCFDKLNISADLSFGDCYINGEESNLGKTNIIVRTNIGKKVINECSEIMNLKSAKKIDIQESQFLSSKEYDFELGLKYFNIYKNSNLYINKEKDNLIKRIKDKYNLIVNNLYSIKGKNYKGYNNFLIKKCFWELILKIIGKVRGLIKKIGGIKNHE